MLKEFINKKLITIYMSNLLSILRCNIRKKSITILLYHWIDPAAFNTHLEYLTKIYNLIDLDLLYEAFFGQNRDCLPEHSLLITFDDGWRSNYDLLPVFKKYNCRATIFLTAGLIGTNRKIWNYTLNGKKINDLQLNKRLKNIPNELKNKLLFKKNGYYPEKEYPTRDMLNIGEIKVMCPFVDFQSHGMFHSVFTMCTDEELDFELRKSKDIISNITNKECYALCYPYGLCGEREIKFAKNADYKMGRIANKPDLTTLSDNPMRLVSVGIREYEKCIGLRRNIAWNEINFLLKRLIKIKRKI